MRESFKHMRIYNKIYASFSDERYSYDLITWFKIYHDVKEHGYGYARNKYKIEILDKDGNKTGEYWKVTTKDIKKMMRRIEEEQLITRFIEASKWIEKQIKSTVPKEEYEKMKNMPRLGDILVDWRNKHSTMNNRIAQRRKDVSPTLSDAA